MADRLRGRGQRVDELVPHHPSGVARGTNTLEEGPLVAVLALSGVPRATAEAIVKTGAARRWREYDDSATDVVVNARRFGFPLECFHNPADFRMLRLFRSMLDGARPERVADVVALLETIPEFGPALAVGAGPRVIAGSPDRPAGRIYVRATGWLFPPVVYSLLASVGVSTVVQISVNDAQHQAAEQCGMNVVRVPHYAADSVGVNLVLDDVERLLGPLEVIPCHGFERIRREGSEAFSVL